MPLGQCAYICFEARQFLAGFNTVRKVASVGKDKENWHCMEATEVAKALGSSMEQGLRENEALRRLAKYGENRLIGKKKESPVLLFFRQFLDFMVLVLIGAALISFAFGEMADALMIMVIVIVNGILGFVQEYKAERSLEALKDLILAEAHVIRDGVFRKIPATDLVPGDLVLLESGSRVPADLRLTEGFNLEAEESALTGESRPVKKRCEPLWEDKPLAERHNLCFSGSSIARGRGKGIVIATGMETEMGRIAALLHEGSREETPLQRRLRSLGKWLIAFCLTICGLVAAIGIYLGENIFNMLLTGVSLAVASIPEGLPAIVTISLALGVRQMAKSRAIVRRLPAVETLGCTTFICSDKTGTLTRNTMEVRYIHTGGGWQKVEDFHPGAGDLSLLVMANCHDVAKGAEGLEGDPTEKALLELALLRDAQTNLPRLEEIPFDSSRRRMSVLVDWKGKKLSLVKGAPDTIFALCRKIETEKGPIAFTEIEKRRLLEEAGVYTDRSYRLLALAYRPDPKGEKEMERDLVFLALTAIADPIRPDVPGALAKAREARIHTAMITGDDPRTALAIGRELGMETAVLTGRELDEMSEEEMRRQIRKTSIFARVDPAHKLKIVRILKGEGEIVAMTGDGVNDAPAIKEADIGIAMGKKGTDVTKEAADFILADDNFATIVKAVFHGRGIYDNIRKFIRYLLACNIGEVLVMFFAVLLGMPLPLLPLQILWINLVTDGLPALAIAMDKPEPGLMSMAPRSPKEGVFSRGLGFKIGFRGILIGVTTLFLFLFVLIREQDIILARTVAFTALVMCQLFHVFDCRSERETVFKLGFFSNPWLLGAVALSLLMQITVIYWPFLQNIFATTPLGWDDWRLILLFTGAPTIVSAFKYLLWEK